MNVRLNGLALCLPIAFAGCSTMPKNPARPVTTALHDTAETTLGRMVGPELAEHAGQSGFHPLLDGADAFVARLVLAHTAERCLDVQYYMFHNDSTGRALMGELIHAAERGVRVRLLIDDIHAVGQDESLATIAAIPNMSVRVFNPFGHRSAHWLDLLVDFRRVNRRMHNKSFTADNQLTILGGRNIGDEYFAARTDVDFSDLDVITFGPTVPEVSAVFDEYWNNAVVYPIATLHPDLPDEATRQQLHDDLMQDLEKIRSTPYTKGLADTDLARSLREKTLDLYWGQGTIIADKPEKVTLPPDDDSTHALPKLSRFMHEAREELLLVSPYFVPGKEGTKELCAAAQRGLHVRILTNSYLATDVGAVHAGYMTYREKLLKAGVEIYELKPSAYANLDKKKGHGVVKGSSQASLHAKTYMVDNHKLFVGSFNLDPRSARLNTEMGVILDSEPLCARFRTGFDAHVLDGAYRVTIDPATKDLVWTTRDQGHEVRLTSEPGLSALKRFGLFLARILPVEEQL